MSKQLVLALAAGTTAFAAVVGSAATLGGITSDNLGADTKVVASCDTDGIGVEYSTKYVELTGVYEVSKVTLTGVDDACDGQGVAVTLAETASTAGDTELGEVNATADATGTLDITVPTSAAAVVGPPAVDAVTGVDAEDVEYIAVVISG